MFLFVFVTLTFRIDNKPINQLARASARLSHHPVAILLLENVCPRIENPRLENTPMYCMNCAIEITK